MLKNIEVTRDLLNYINEHAQELHKVQKDILNYNKNLGGIQRMQISEIQGYFLQLLIKIKKVKKCLEIGTFTGFSAFTMALSLPKNGKLITLDRDEKIVKIAKSFFKKGNLEKKIETITGQAKNSLEEMIKKKKKFDLIFVDADKSNYKLYYELSLGLINKNALIIFDNVLWRGNVYKKSIDDKQTNVIRDFNKYIKNDNRVEVFMLPLGDGLTVCRKL